MAFDGIEPTIETRLIDEMLTILGPNGRRWIKGKLADKKGGHCIAGALYAARDKLQPATVDNTEARIMEAIQQRHEALVFLISSFNDRPERTFAEVREVLQLAKTVTPSPAVRLMLETVNKRKLRKQG